MLIRVMSLSGRKRLHRCSRCWRWRGGGHWPAADEPVGTFDDDDVGLARHHAESVFSDFHWYAQSGSRGIALQLELSVVR